MRDIGADLRGGLVLRGVQRRRDVTDTLTLMPLLAWAMVASIVPARRATRLEPTAALCIE